MRSNVSVILAWGMLALTAAAQDESHIVLPGGWLTYLFMLTVPEVEKELKLTDEQVRRAEQLRREMGEKLAKAGMFGPATTPEQGRRIEAEAVAAARVAFRGLLDPDQVRRYEQLYLQNSGIAAFAQEDVVRALKLTDDQRSRIRGIDRAMKLEMIIRPGQDQRVNEARRTAFARALAVLTPEQALTWKGLTGTPLEVKFRTPKGPIVGPARGDAGPRTLDKTGRFAYVQPAGWKVVSGAGFTHDVLWPRSDDDQRMNSAAITFRDQPAEGDLDAARRRHEQHLRDLKEFQVVSSEMVELAGKRNVAKVIHTFSSPDMPMRQVDYIVQVGRERYIVSCQSAKDEGSKHDQEFEALVASMTGVAK